jgi:hypothetical protein
MRLRSFGFASGSLIALRVQLGDDPPNLGFSRIFSRIKAHPALPVTRPQ